MAWEEIKKSEIATPCYVFSADAFKERIGLVQKQLPSIPICYAMKANAFLLHCLPDAIRRVEVCSPGELRICERLGIAPERMIYSGVMKEEMDVREALQYGVAIITAESTGQYQLICRLANRPVQVLLRLSSGNQFGMSAEDIDFVFESRRSDDKGSIIGLHYYSGTAKKKAAQIQKDLDQLQRELIHLKEKYCFEPALVEYGPGLSVQYFGSNEESDEEDDRHLLQLAAPLFASFSDDYPLSLEFGRFLAAPAGTYYTMVRDKKRTDGLNYLICDGGIHHIRYYGQLMGMQVPPIRVIRKERMETVTDRSENGLDAQEGRNEKYCICGSLCTTADVLVREVSFPEKISVRDVLSFGRCGAYAVTEASALFLSRPMPAVYLEDGEEIKLLRDVIMTDELNA